MSTSEQPTPMETLTKEEIAWLIKIMWVSLQAPAWTYKNQKDLGKIGEAIASGKSLKDLDDGLYNRIFPHLVTIATHLGIALKTSSPPEPATEPTSAHVPTPAVAPHRASSPILAQAEASASLAKPAVAEASPVEASPVETGPSATEQTS